MADGHAIVRHPQARPSREDFLYAHLAALKPPPAAIRTERGFSLAGRPYVALPCHCRNPGCPGWAVVHDEPDAIAYFGKLFGAGR